MLCDLREGITEKNTKLCRKIRFWEIQGTCTEEVFSLTETEHRTGKSLHLKRLPQACCVLTSKSGQLVLFFVVSGKEPADSEIVFMFHVWSHPSFKLYLGCPALRLLVQSVSHRSALRRKQWNDCRGVSFELGILHSHSHNPRIQA